MDDALQHFAHRLSVFNDLDDGCLRHTAEHCIGASDCTQGTALFGEYAHFAEEGTFAAMADILKATVWLYFGENNTAFEQNKECIRITVLLKNGRTFTRAQYLDLGENAVSTFWRDAADECVFAELHGV